MATHTHENLGKMYQNIKVNPLSDSQVEIEGEITALALSHFRDHALKHFQEELSVPGFRKGHVPEKITVDKIGELAILEEAGELALQSCYAEILSECRIDPLGTPKVAITKLALGNPMSFKITTSVFPEFTLSNYKKLAGEIAGKQESADVLEYEIEEAINTIRKLKAQDTKQSVKPASPASGEAGGTEHNSDSAWPPLTEELVKTFGKFESLADFKNKIKQSLIKEKEMRNREKIRLGIIKAIIEKNDIPLPRVLIDGELDRMIAKMKDDIERMGLKIPDYLKQIKKTESDLRKEWEKDAIERAKMELILHKVAEVEKIEAPQEEIEAEVKHLMEHYADADPIRAASYFEHVIRNEKVFQFLENQ
ncbi:MAG: trigger factor [bacterium]|nr:trigger factor [bacterium]